MWLRQIWLVVLRNALVSSRNLIDMWYEFNIGVFDSGSQVKVANLVHTVKVAAYLLFVVLIVTRVGWILDFSNVGMLSHISRPLDICAICLYCMLVTMLWKSSSFGICQ